MSQKRDEIFEAAKRDQAKHEDSDGYFGFLTGADWAREWTLLHDERVLALVEALEECLGEVLADHEQEPYLCKALSAGQAREALTQYRESVKERK